MSLPNVGAEELVPFLRHWSPRVRSTVLQALVAMQWYRLSPDTIDFLDGDPDETVQQVWRVLKRKMRAPK